VEPITATGADVELVVDRDIHPVASLTRVLESHPGSVAVVGTRGQGGFATGDFDADADGLAVGVQFGESLGSS
jgi:hypothetical protein